jgi:hypothetical protein
MEWPHGSRSAYDSIGEIMKNEGLSVCVCIFLLSFIISNIAYADEMSDARASANTIFRKLEQRKNAEVWESDVSDWFKEKMTRDAFLANMTITEAQLGGSSTDRKLIQQNQANGEPRSGYKGKVFSFLFDTTFPAAKVYEMIVLIRERGAYKVSGINYVPNPN